MKHIILTIFIVFILTGCDRPKDDKSHNTEILELKYRISLLEYELDTFYKKPLQFYSKSKGYQVAKTNIGNFPIFLKEAPNSTNGYNAKFTIGNPYSFIIYQFDINVAWTDGAKRTKEKTFTISKDLMPAVWNDVSINIPPETGNSISTIQIEFMPQNIKFEGDYRKILQRLEAMKLLQSLR